MLVMLSRDRLCSVPISMLLVLSLAVVFGCQRREEITRYTVAKPLPLEPVATKNPHAGGAMADEPPSGAPTDRTLAAIVPLEPQGWFFKLTGPTDAVAAQEEVFTTFLKTVGFPPGGNPTWTLPEGWTQQPGNQIRYATLLIPAEGKPLELSVTALPNSGGDVEAYVLVNVNRWRGQLRLPPVGQEQLSGESTKVELDGATATVVNLVGHAAPNTMGRPPFVSGAPDGN
jgi:hypothetical protein